MTSRLAWSIQEQVKIFLKPKKESLKNTEELEGSNSLHAHIELPTEWRIFIYFKQHETSSSKNNVIHLILYLHDVFE